MAVVRFDATDVGRRVTVRRRDPIDPDRMSDVVGVLEQWRDGALLIRRRDDTVSTVPDSTLVAGRIVAPEVSSMALAQVCADHWPATQAHDLNGWRLLYYESSDGRHCSTLALKPCTTALSDQLDQVREWCHDRGAQPTIAVVEGSAIDDVLQGLPATACHDVMVATTRDVIGHEPAGSGDVHTGTTADAPGTRYVVAQDDTGTSAKCRVTPRGEWAAVTHVQGEHQARGSAVASAVLIAAAREADRAGSRQLWVSIEHDDRATQRLLNTVGFVRHHGCVHRDAS